MNKELLKQLNEAAAFVCFKYEKEQEIEEIKEKLSSTCRKEAEIKVDLEKRGHIGNKIVAGLSFLQFGLGGLIIVIIGICALFATGDALSLIFIVIGALFLYLVIRMFRKHKTERDRLKKELKETQQRLENERAEAQKEIAEIKETISKAVKEGEPYLSFLPKKYQTVHAIAFLIDVVENMRADTLKEALNLYEQRLAELERLDTMQEIYENQAEAFGVLRSQLSGMTFRQDITNILLAFK